MGIKIKEPEKIKKSGEKWGLKFVAGVLGFAVVIQSPILTMLPRFFSKQIEVVNGQIPLALWGLFAASVGAAALTWIDKIWTKKREDAAKAAVEKAKARRARDERFFERYAECLALAIEAAQDSEAQGIEAVCKTQVAVLQLVRDVVSLFLGEPNGPLINASLMRAEPVSLWSENHELKHVKFCAPNRVANDYRCVLHLTQWAKRPNEVGHFVLPVAETEDVLGKDILLFGAPRAFLLDQMEYVADTQDETSINALIAMQEEGVCADILAYLQSRKNNLRSFICLSLRCGEEVMGVLNVQSNRPEILGVDEEYRSDLQNSLLPFCALLGILIAQENRSQGATATPEEASKPEKEKP